MDIEDLRCEAIRRVAEAIRAQHSCTEIGNCAGGYDCRCGEPWLAPTFDGCLTRHRAADDAEKYIDALGDLLPTAYVESRGGASVYEWGKTDPIRRIPEERRYMTEWIEVPE